MLDLASLPLFGWWWTGHQQITKEAVALAVSLLATGGALKRLQLEASNLKTYLAGLWLMNVCQDIDLGNAVGKAADLLKCGIELPGGQVAHFMRDKNQRPVEAYQLSRSRIRKCSLDAWMFFKIAFPMQLPEGWKGTAQKVASVVTHVVVPVLGPAEGAANLNAQKHLARALHCLQDSFSPAHTKRDRPPVPTATNAYTSMVIRDVYNWDKANKEPNPATGWPGHADYDKPTYAESRTYYLQPAINASAELIACVIGNAQGTKGTCETALDNLLNDVLPKHFT
jgi:hypothetical protein